MIVRNIALRTCLIAAFLFTGCGDGGKGIERRVRTHEVRGKVLLADGTPMPGGVVRFIPVPKKGSEDEATGEIQSDGTFQMTTRKTNDGAAAGEYKVRIDPIGPALMKDKSKKPAEIPRKYLDEDLSGLTATVKEGSNNLPPFEIK